MQITYNETVFASLQLMRILLYIIGCKTVKMGQNARINYI